MADEGLESRLASHSAYFNSLVELVPAKYYLPDDDEEKFNRFHRNRKHKAPKQAIKEASKKAKRLRLDPSEHKTVLEMQVENERQERGESSEDEEEVSNRFSSLSSKNRDVDGHDIRLSLHSKIEQLRSKRKAGSKKRENRPKKKTKLEIKEKKKKDGVKPPVRESKQFQGDDNKVVFSKFDFISQYQEKGPRSGNKGQNYKKLLAQAEARKSKLNKMKESDAQRAKEAAQKQTWKTALLKAAGGKPKDDPKLLKKSMKRKEKQKNKSKKQWKEREDNIKKQKDDKQKVRKQHIRERSEVKKGKKRGKGKKKNYKPGF